MNSFDDEKGHKNHSDWRPFTILSTVSSSASVMGALCILFSILFPHKRSMSRHFIYMMSFSDIMVALPILCGCIYRIANHGSLPEGRWCQVQAFFVTVGSLLSFLWSLGLSQHMFLLVKYGVSTAYIAYRSFWFLSLLPIAINIYAWEENVLGIVKVCNHTVNPLSWCWINVNVDHGTHCMALIWDGKFWEISSYLVVFVYCGLTYYQLNRVNRLWECTVVPSGTILTMVFVYNGCQKPVDDDQTFYLVLVYLRTILDASQGWINWILFWLTIEGNRECLKLCSGGGWCCWRKGPREEGSTTNTGNRGGETVWRYSIDSVDY